MTQTNQPESLDFLLANICHLHHSRVHQLFEAIGLYRGQPPVLNALWKKEGVTQSELAEVLKITPATMTKMLQRMEKTGFIDRQPDPNDQRISRVYLTEYGHQIKSDVEALFAQMEAETFTQFTSEERIILHRFLLTIRTNLLNATGEEPWK
jgi:DNA-binding MarR family transcriptional regulator